MAILKSNLEFTGSLGNLSAYELPGVGTVLRTKGGAKKKQIQKSPKFQRTRENYTEFSGCAKMGGSIRQSMLVMAPLADYNFTPVLNSLAKTIQLLDTECVRGERNIYLSRYKHLLTGFSLNRNSTFESIVKHPLHCTIDRENKRAVVQLPELMPGVNLILSKQYPLFRFIVNLGGVADRLFSTYGYVGAPMESRCVYTDWHHATQLFDAAEALVELKDTAALPDDTTLILSVGIQMGTPVTDTVVNPVKYAGCAKIMGVA